MGRRITAPFGAPGASVNDRFAFKIIGERKGRE